MVGVYLLRNSTKIPNRSNEHCDQKPVMCGKKHIAHIKKSSACVKSSRKSRRPEIHKTTATGLQVYQVSITYQFPRIIVKARSINAFKGKLDRYLIHNRGIKLRGFVLSIVNRQARTKEV